MSQTDELFDPAAAPITVDRSTLERWSNCPWQAWGCDHVLTMPDVSDEATAGSECHDIISKAITARIDGARHGDIVDLIQELSGESRPDVQPQVVDALSYGARTVASRICYRDDGEERPFEEIARYDGGQGEHRGQLAMPWKLDDVDYLLTGEVDLLLATASVAELDLDDWKSGRKHWTATNVQSSFQFQFYSELVFQNYPSLEQVNVRVIMPAAGMTTSPVPFRQKGRTRIRQRIGTALATYHKYHGQPTPDGIPTYPGPDRCEWCACCLPGKCPLVRKDAKDLPNTPEGLLLSYYVTAQALDAMGKLLTARVRETGQDVESGVLRFGVNKPPAKAKACALYEVSATETKKGRK